MRVIVFFDLPVVSKPDRRAYTRFRKTLIKAGFMMVQQSVYSKLALNHTSANATVDFVKRNKPEKGNIQVLTITEKQYSKIEIIVGKNQNDVINTDERTIIL